MTAALIQDLHHGLMADMSDTEYPTQVYGLDAPEGLILVEPGTFYGYVASGKVNFLSDGVMQSCPAGYYFSVPFTDMLSVFGAEEGTKAFGVLRLGYQGMFTLGGPVENKGRLRYIDGCTDTLLLSPPVKGDPCYNLLHFPTGIDQTEHTHPTMRAGYIHRGAGACRTATGKETLAEGKVFILYPDALHAFETGDSEMTLTVFHPESDWGPDHEEHPMLNRTTVDGVSARYLDDIRTQAGEA